MEVTKRMNSLETTITKSRIWLPKNIFVPQITTETFNVW